MPIKDLGITDSDLSKQYQYTKDIVTDSKGVLKGLSWQGCPGVLFYNRDAAKEVLGTDDPDKVQEYVKDWDTYNDTAKKMKDAGYKMTASANDTYRVYSNNVTSKWVDGNKINIDDNIMKWVDDSKAQVDAGETGTCDLWSDDWSKGFYPQGKVFCYFGPAWLVNFSMAADTEITSTCLASIYLSLRIVYPFHNVVIDIDLISVYPLRCYIVGVYTVCIVCRSSHLVTCILHLLCGIVICIPILYIFLNLIWIVCSENFFGCISVIEKNTWAALP